MTAMADVNQDETEVVTRLAPTAADMAWSQGEPASVKLRRLRLPRRKPRDTKKPGELRPWRYVWGLVAAVLWSCGLVAVGIEIGSQVERNRGYEPVHVGGPTITMSAPTSASRHG